MFNIVLRYFTFTIFTFLFSIPSFPQLSGSYSFPENFDKYYNFKPNEAFDYLNKAPLSGLTKEQSDKFRINTIYNTQFDFDDDKVYLNWYQAENYLYKILDTIIPPQIRKKRPFNIIVTRSTEINAYSQNNGFLFINIGLLATIRNEAALACVIGHEAGHAIFDHGYQGTRDFYNTYSNRNSNSFFDFYLALYAKSRRYELEADTFSAKCIAKCGYSLEEAGKEFESFDNRKNIYSKSTNYKRLEAGNNAGTVVEKRKSTPSQNPFASHPSEKERLEKIKKFKTNFLAATKKSVVDSVFFYSLRKIAREERKKITFENCEYNQCAQYCFIDYMYNPKSLKNLYYLIESLRRAIYIKPMIANKGFLFQNFENYFFYEYGSSSLENSDFLFEDVQEYSELKNHPFITGPEKPFGSNEQAFVFFCKEALKLNLKEANLTLALYYYFKNDEENYKFYLGEYLTNENAAHYEYAKTLRDNHAVKLNGKKKLIIYDNIGNYSGEGFNFNIGFNYLSALNKKKLNTEIAPALVDDTSKTKCVLMNELLGNKPALLYQYQKLTDCIKSLYDEEDISVFKKKRLTARETMEETQLRRLHNKNLLILAPEFYDWMNENDLHTLFFVEVLYTYKQTLDGEEFANTYTGYYLDINESRPYFKDAVRGGHIRKQTDKEILSDLNYFLYGKE
jgi:hypothetical protein